MKAVSDFTSVVQFRHPNEVGGAQWSFSQLMNVAALFIALHLADAEGVFGVHMVTFWRLGFVIAGSSALGFAVFFRSINSEYIYTFFSFETAGQMTVRAFQVHSDDALKAEAIFSNNVNQWKGIRGEVKEWVWESWPGWMEEKPAWLNEKMRSMIPVDMMPSLKDPKRIVAEGGKGGKGATAKGATARGVLNAEEGATMLSMIQSQMSSVIGVGEKAAEKHATVAPEGEEGAGVSKQVSEKNLAAIMKCVSGHL